MTEIIAFLVVGLPLIGILWGGFFFLTWALWNEIRDYWKKQ